MLGSRLGECKDDFNKVILAETAKGSFGCSDVLSIVVGIGVGNFIVEEGRVQVQDGVDTETTNTD